MLVNISLLDIEKQSLGSQSELLHLGELCFGENRPELCREFGSLWMVCTDAFIFKVSQNILETSAFTQPKEKGRIPEAQHSTEQLAGMCVSVSVYLCVRERESISLQ